MRRGLIVLSARLSAALGLVLALAVDPAAASELRIAVARGTVSLPFVVAEAERHFAAEGIAVRTVPCSSGRECFSRLQAGEADLATAAELVMALETLKPAPAAAAIVASISASGQQIKLVARRSAGIADARQLRGRRVGYVEGTSTGYFLDRWLVYHEMATADVQAVPLPVERTIGALTQRQIDALVVWEPLAAQAAAALGDDGLVLSSPRVYVQHFTLIATRQALAERERYVVAVLRALARATAFIAARPHDAAALLQTRSGLDASQARAALNEHEYRLQLGPALLSTMDAQQRWARRQGLVPAAPSAAPLLLAVEPSLLHKAVPGAVTLPLKE